MVEIMALCALSTFSLTKNLLQYTQPFFLIGVRMTLAGGILLALYYYFSKKRAVPIKDYNYFFQIIFFALYIPYFLRYYGLLHCSASRAFILYNLGPLVTYLGTAFFGIEKITIKKTIALFISYCGLLFIAPTFFDKELFAQPLTLADGALLASIVSFSYGWIVIRKLIVNNNYSTFYVNGITMFGAGLMAFITTFFMEQPPYITEVVPFIMLVLVIVVISNILCHTWYALLLKKYSLTLLALGSFFTPLVAKLYAIVFLHEPFSLHFYNALFFITAGFLLFYGIEHRILLSKFSLKRYLFDRVS